ncbi:PilZ domain-containing protein [Cyanobium sp. Morenito 9A2]|uniref:PilZ domain-containing protein n=1 Tax=Cyanobium sp. Morenito 9A2 TaxID=2823718 RepID=UPI0020CC4641|nr:PilZ domain-containing protein [Cyanobium sp. Morenito 9A2]MCP9850798.1 PilZ domain-containing protein [Cyanobium sp. Morenito 9A2]
MNAPSEPTDFPPRSKRQLLPSAIARVDATFTSSDGISIRGRLWDISPAGAGIQFNQTVSIAENTLGSLVLHHSYSHAELTLEAEVCWVAKGSASSLIGTVFSSTIKPGTFLDAYF